MRLLQTFADVWSLQVSSHKAESMTHINLPLSFQVVQKSPKPPSPPCIQAQENTLHFPNAFNQSKHAIWFRFRTKALLCPPLPKIMRIPGERLPAPHKSSKHKASYPQTSSDAQQTYLGLFTGLLLFVQGQCYCLAVAASS